MWQAQYFYDVFRRCAAVFVAGAARRVHRHFAWQAQHLRRVVLRVFFANRIVRAVSSGDKVQIWQAWHFVFYHFFP